MRVVNAHIDALCAYIKAITECVNFIGRLANSRKLTVDNPDIYADYGMRITAIENTRQAAVVAVVHAGDSRNSMQQLHIKIMESIGIYRQHELNHNPDLKATHSLIVDRLTNPVKTLNDLLAILDSKKPTTGVPPEQKIPRQKAGPRFKNDDLLAFDQQLRKRNTRLTDKEVLKAFQKKKPNHPIFQAGNPEGALRAARSRSKSKHKSV